MLKFRLTLTDTDGQEQQYPFTAPDALAVAVYVDGETANGGDFYGHRRQSIGDSPVILNVAIDAMLPTWDGDGLTFQALYRADDGKVTTYAQ